MSLEVLNLKKEYRHFLRKNSNVLAVDDLSFRIENAEIYALVGQNGAGKTTTIKCILNLISKTSGKVTFNGEDIYVLMERAGVGYMPEFLYFPEGISLRNYLIEIGILRKMKTTDVLKKIEFLADLLDMKAKMASSVNKYSKGMKKKANFMQAVMHDPDFLVLDEPTDGLDAVSRRIVLDYIRKMADSGCTILITSHILADLERVSHRAGIIHDGRLLDEVSTDQFRNSSYTNDFKWDMEEWYFNTLIKAGDMKCSRLLSSK